MVRIVTAVLALLLSGCQAMIFPRVQDIQLHECVASMSFNTLQIKDCHVTVTRSN